MKLEASSGAPIHGPTPSDVIEALRGLAEDGAFVILSTAPEDYVQAAGTATEYRRGGRHLAAENLTPDTRERIFLSYLDGNDDFTRLAPWRDVTETVGTPPRTQKIKIPMSVIVIIIVIDTLIALAIVAWALGWFDTAAGTEP